MSRQSHIPFRAEWTRREWLERIGLGLFGVAASGALCPPMARAATLTDAELMRSLGAWIKHSDLPVPMPSLKERTLLLQGKMLKKWLPPRPGAPVGAMGMIITGQGQAEMWLSSADGLHMSGGSREGKLTSHHLPKKGDEMFRWYGFIDLPAPFADRHFLIRTTVNPRAAAETDGQVWERTWRLEPDGMSTVRPLVEAGAIKGLSPERFEAAIYVPGNMGGWVSIRLPDGRTLFSYHASSSVGGDIPDKLINRMVMLNLGKLVTDVETFAKTMRGHYVSGHAPVRSGDGGHVPFF
ncbi:MAG: hypothetical protein CL927_14790 [Deltaproteobacteria bacterium]|nr:hypothetical protein [Deltaproteobacteria bacterium]